MLMAQEQRQAQPIPEHGGQGDAKMPVTHALRILALALSVMCMLLANAAHATHFRFGNISWRSDDGTTVQATLQNAWRRDGYSSCVDVTALTLVPCRGPGGHPAVGDVIDETIGGTTFNWGDGSPPVGSPLGELLYLVTSIDINDNWLLGLALNPDSLPAIDPTLRHSYALPGDYLAYIESCCRISAVSPPYEHINNPDGGYRVETLIHTPSVEASPVSILPPLVNCTRGATCNFLALGGDQDGGPVQYRMSTSAEASGGSGFTQPGPPDAPLGAHIGTQTGIYSWNDSGATLATDPHNDTLYSTQVTLTDSTSKVGLDFLIRLVRDTSQPPRIVSPPNTIPICNTVQLTTIEEPIEFTLTASDPDAGQFVTFNVVGLPFGADTVPTLPQSGNPVQATFQWTPDASQGADSGQPHVIEFFATSNAGRQTLCPVTVLVYTSVPCDTDGDEDVDTNDIGAIFDARNTPSGGPTDTRDVNKDNWISVADARYCVYECDEADCAEPPPLGKRHLRHHTAHAGEQQP